MSKNIKIDKIISTKITNNDFEWFQSFGVSDYDFTINRMENIVKNIIDNKQKEQIWICEHTPLYTTGSSSNNISTNISGIPVFNTRRGGKDTYHGTGQLTVYMMIDLKKRHINIKQYIQLICEINIGILKKYNINGFFDQDDIGVWVKTNTGQDKICAIGVKIRKGVSFFGFGFNISPNIENFYKITPCGISKPGYGVTSLEKIGIFETKEKIIEHIIEIFEEKISMFSQN